MGSDKPDFRTLAPMFEELRGERVLIRPYNLDDAPALMEAVAESRDHIRPWLPFADRHQAIEESRDWITQMKAKWLLHEDMNCGIWEQHSGRFLGGVGLHSRNWDIRYYEIGYWLRKSAEGHGYMTEAVKLVADYALNELRANRVEIRCDELNERSAAVARRLGFVQEARLRNREPGPDGSPNPRTMLIFSLVPGDPW